MQISAYNCGTCNAFKTNGGNCDVTDPEQKYNGYWVKAATKKEDAK